MNIKNININYIEYGKGDVILFLHGWGQNIEMMKPLGDYFENNRVIILDLPGFGESDDPDSVYSVLDYVYFIKEFNDKLKIENPVIVGHSFGGKIGLLYASMFNVKKLICLASPYKKSVLKISIKIKVLKFLKKVPVLNKLESFAKKRIGSADYKSSSDFMRKVLVETVNYDISEKVSLINCSVLLIWGDKDLAVDIADAYELEGLIADCGLVVYENCTHYAYLERLDQTRKVLESFIGG